MDSTVVPHGNPPCDALFYSLPTETVIFERQKEYDAAIGMKGDFWAFKRNNS